MSNTAGVPPAGASVYQDKTLVDGRQLVAARAIVGWTVREMAAAAGVHRTTVCRIEAERHQLRAREVVSPEKHPHALR